MTVQLAKQVPRLAGFRKQISLAGETVTGELCLGLAEKLPA
jgi:hypothetical protein